MAIKDHIESDRWFNVSETIAEALRHRAMIFLLLVVLVFIYNFPIYYMAVNSLKALETITAQPLNVLPVNLIDPVWKNYADIWTQRNFDYYFSNSLIIAIVTTGIVMVFGTLTGYGFSRFRFPFDDYLFIGVLVVRLLPPIGLIVPFFRFFQNVHLLDSEFALIIVYTYFNLPLVTWLMRNYFIAIPTDLDEAAYVDGATRFQTFKDIILPIAKPGIAATLILTFLFSWREFVMALVLTISPDAVTLPVGATFMVEDVLVYWQYLAAAAFFAMLPGLLLVILFQEYVVEGVAGGAVKG